MILKVLSLSFLFTVIVTVSVSQAAKSEYSWKKLNEKLFYGGYNSDDYIKLAERRLKRIRSSCFQDKKMLATLERLEEFRSTVQKAKCDPETRAYIKSFQDEIKDYYAIKSITASYLRATAEGCQEANVNSYTEKVATLPSGLSGTFERLQTFFIEIAHCAALDWRGQLNRRRAQILDNAPSFYINLARSNPSEQRSIYHALIVKDHPLATGITADIAYDAIELLASEECESEEFAKYVAKNELGRRVITPEAARELFDLWIIQPCKAYVEEFGPAVFEYAEADRQIWPYPRLLMVHHNDSTSKYYFAWAQYKGCLRLINNREEREKLLGYLGKIAEIITRVRSNPDRKALSATDINEIPGIKLADFKTKRALDIYDSVID